MSEIDPAGRRFWAFFSCLIGGYILCVTTQNALAAFGGGEVQSTEALVTDIQNIKLRSETMKALDIEYQAGAYPEDIMKTYTGQVTIRPLESGEIPKPGSKVTVYYLDKNPQRPFIDRHIPRKSKMWFVMGLAFLAAGLMGFRKSRHNQTHDH